MDLITGFFSFLLFLFFAGVWLLPIILIASSDRTTGKEKFAWILAVIFITWFAWIFYMLLAPIKPKDRYGY
ncbi:MAG: hypothetical protein GKR90_01150 [Pseudomonadales bacterium]|nr:hypothetical protein [Pseudomonadales bacterium]